MDIICNSHCWCGPVVWSNNLGRNVPTCCKCGKMYFTTGTSTDSRI